MMLMHTHTGNKENAGSCMRLHWTIPVRWFYVRLMHNAIASRRAHCWCNFVLYTRTVASIDVWLHPTTACYVGFSFLVVWLYAAFCVWCTTLSPFILVLSSRVILHSAWLEQASATRLLVLSKLFFGRILILNPIGKWVVVTGQECRQMHFWQKFLLQ